MEAAPICANCHITLDTWAGNVMVDALVYPERIRGLQVICKACTRQLDASGIGRQLHNFWELSWIKKSPMSRLAEVLSDGMQTKNGDTRWDAEAIKELGFLVALTLPYDEARIFLRFLNTNEWDDDGEYLTRLKSIHQIDLDE